MSYKVLEMRKKLGLTQEELCKLADISRQTLSDLENVESTNTTTQTLIKIASALNCKVSDIFCPDVQYTVRTNERQEVLPMPEMTLGSLFDGIGQAGGSLQLYTMASRQYFRARLKRSRARTM